MHRVTDGKNTCHLLTVSLSLVDNVLQHVGQQLRATQTRHVAPRRVAPKPLRRLAPHKFQQANIAYVKVSVLHS